MAGIAIGLIAGATIFGAGTSIAAGKTNEAIAKQNAQIQRLQAVDTIERGEEEVSLIRKQAKNIKSEQRAALAGQGVDLGSDVVEAIEINTDMEIENEIASVRNNAARIAWGQQVGAQQTTFQGSLSRSRGISQGIGTLLGGAADIATVKATT